MFSITIYLYCLLVAVVAAVCVWGVSVFKHDVSIVDSLWPVLFILMGFSNAILADHWGARSELLLSLLSIWGLRLSVYITWRNLGHGEDRRYQAIRARNQPNFSLKSFYLVFALQAVLAWVISLPLHGAILADGALGVLDAAGAALWLLGFVFEAGGDWQLATFKADPTNRGRVMDRGFWRLTRHPNYFGDFCVWWGFYAIAAGAGAWWSILGPAVMSLLLMRVSGAALLEKDIGDRRPEYADYIRRTNAFFPGAPRGS